MDKLAIAVLLLSILAVLYAWKVHKRKMHASRRDPSLAHRHTDFICRRDWVEHITGMTEPELRAGDNIRSVIKAERVPEYSTYKFTFVNAATRAEYEAGYFYTETVGSMQREFDERPGDKSVFRSCKFIADLRQDYASTKFVDVAYLQALRENNGAMFQAASNFNGIEAVSEKSWPDRDTFLTDYINDNTQGPSASISAGAAAISRVLLPFYNESDTSKATSWRQSHDRQVELLKGLEEYCTVENGYIVQKGTEREVTDDEWDAVVGRVRVGVHVDAQVQFGHTDASRQMEVVPRAAGQRISQVFCAAMNLGQGLSGYTNAGYPGSKRMSEALLEAAYRGTYLAAIRHGSPRLFLTLIGGGVFRNDVGTIMRVIEKVHLEIACTEKNVSLREVHVVLFNEPVELTEVLNNMKSRGVETELHSYRDGGEIIYTDF